MSDDGKQGIALIAFIGSVFSPYYAWRRRRGPADPLAHCALNVAVYSPRGKHWAMTERGAGAVHRTATTFAVGPSALEWNGATLTVHIDEISVPWPTRLRGTVRLHARTLPGERFTLDREGLHTWAPLAPLARIEVDLPSPGCKWSGDGYFDCNAGATPLESSFAHWHWSRAAVGDSTIALYNATSLAGEEQSHALRYTATGIEPLASLSEAALPSTLWGIGRRTRSDTGNAFVERTLEDTPFYARSVVASRAYGQDCVAVHESLSLTRFRSPWVQAMLPFRMPRRAR